MSLAIILDTETTDADNPQVIELAWTDALKSALTVVDVRLVRFKPSKPISLGAMATHHIIEADLLNCPTWPGKWDVPAGVQYIVGHNVDFDWKAIGSPNVKRICTLALARYVWPKLDSHSLGALIYHIYPQSMARELLKNAHNAAEDVKLCHRVLDQVWDAVGRPDTWEKLWEASEKARIPERISFGKYGPQNGEPGMLIKEMRRKDPNYVQWLLSGKCDIVNNDPYLKKALTQ